MRVLITDAEYKHAAGLARQLRSLPDVARTVGLCRPGQLGAARRRGRWFQELHEEPLPEALDRDAFDLVIPVGWRSVVETARHPTRKKILPPADIVETCLDKQRTLDLCRQIGVPVPATVCPTSVDELGALPIRLPCVVKGPLEAGRSVVAYAQSHEAMAARFREVAADPSQRGRPPLVQERVAGTGAGFFAFYQNGTLKRWYIHRRVREFPPTGGYSTAAETWYHPDVYEYGRRILDELKWHGPAMVEFKVSAAGGEVWFMEVNPKLWGSLELGLAAGFELGAWLVAAHRGEDIPIVDTPDAYRRLKFLWPLDGDLRQIWSRRALGDLLDYLHPRNRTNLRTLGLTASVLSATTALRALLGKPE